MASACAWRLAEYFMVIILLILLQGEDALVLYLELMPYEQQLSSRSGERHAHSDTEPFKTRSPSTATSGIAPTLGDDRGYTSDDPQRHHGSISSLSTLSERADSAVSLAKDSTEWIHLDHKDGRHEPAAFLKVGETLAFLVRDAAHVTPENFDS
uniref:Uncharacterized protein n=1 Tax=Parascaris equorum TaxID=6256 RepID=A0A914RTN3_PAREQ